ncbi:MAG TPA: hypothetical protein VI775_02610 [Candidatus Paceibacterota bacterium]
MPTIKNNHNRGYIGLIVILVVVTITVFVMMKQYQSLGIIKSEESSVNNESISGSGNTTVPLTPIESAQNAKNLIENRDRNMIGE